MHTKYRQWGFLFLDWHIAVRGKAEVIRGSLKNCIKTVVIFVQEERADTISQDRTKSNSLFEILFVFFLTHNTFVSRAFIRHPCFWQPRSYRNGYLISHFSYVNSLI